MSDLQAVRDSHRYCRNIKDMGVLWVSDTLKPQLVKCEKSRQNSQHVRQRYINFPPFYLLFVTSKYGKMFVCLFFAPQGNLHDRYGHIVALSAKYLCLKMEFHTKVRLNKVSLVYYLRISVSDVRKTL